MLTAGSSLGPYTIVAALGKGGMGEVYRAHDGRLGRDVAIKVLPPRESSPDLRARFEREARIASQLNHPNICTLYDVGHADGVDYFVMELIAGETLAARLARGPLPVPQLLASGQQMAAALAQAHRAGLVHRDLKPGNLMCTDSGVKLLDFGLARLAGAPAGHGSASQAPTVNTPLTAIGAVVGTYPYMAPEQLEGREADARSDLFAAGCVLYEMATGRRPFAGEDPMAILGSMLRDTPAPLTALNPAMPRGLEPIVARCLERDPARRYADAVELVAALEALREWPRREGIPELGRICDRIFVMEETPDSWLAFRLAQEIDALSPDDPQVERLRPEFSRPVTITSEPPGAAVFAAYYGTPDDEIALGVTPLEGIRYPRGLTRLRLELPGRRTAHDLVWNLSDGMNDATRGDGVWHYPLRRPGEIPDEMEEVPPGSFPMYLPGLDHLAPEPIAAFLMDRHPVTNREYQRFVDDGGYDRRELWRGPFMEDGRERSWDEARARFVDATGRPGPAEWEMGAHAEGLGDHPVSGVSWHEAGAYAAWAGKSLPTLFHWSRVAFTFVTSQIVPFANNSGRGTVPVGSTRCESRFGCHDLAGNVREWVVNATNRPGEHFILGGGWNDHAYAFTDAYGQHEFDRSPANGFRCMRALGDDPNAANLARGIEMPFRDFAAEKPVPDEVFAFFLRQFHYDRTPLDARVVADRESPFGGRWQTIEFAAAYGGERMTAQLLLPARGTPPWPVVVLFPGSLAIHTRTFDVGDMRRTDFIVRSGRAVILPVYKGTYERGGELTSDYPDESASYRDHVLQWGKDLGRTIDYAETRADLDATRVAYFGLSWGGALGAIMPAVEKRIRANVLYVAGFSFQRALPEADQLNYAPRVTQPTLMLNGELDFFFPAETSQKPMFELLGAPPEQKKRLTYPRGHTVPKLELIRETLAWLDRWTGPV